MRESPRYMQYPVIDLLVSTHPPQFKSLNALNLRSEEAGKNSPSPGDFFTY